MNQKPKAVQIVVGPGRRDEHGILYALDSNGDIWALPIAATGDAHFEWEEIPALPETRTT